MMIRNLMITTLAISMFAASAKSDTVNAANVTTFQANTPAVASEVNGTVQALITAINDNADRITDLEAAASSNDVSGESYFVVELEVGSTETGVAPDLSSIGLGFSFSGTMTFGLDGTASINGTEFEFEHGPGLGVTSVQAAASGSFTFTQTGSVVTLTDTSDGDVITLQVSQSGEVLSGRSIDTAVSPDEADTNVLIAIRQ